MMAITRHLQPIPFDPGQGLPHRRAHGDLVGRDGRPSLGAGADRGGVRRLRESQSRQGELGLVRPRHHHAALRRDAQSRGRHQDGPRALQGQRAGDRRTCWADRSRCSSIRPCCRISWPAGCAGWRCWPTRAGRTSPRSRRSRKPAMASRAATAGSACWRRPARRPPIVTRMAQAIDEALKSPDVLDRLDKGGLKATYLDPAAMRTQIDTESELLRRHHQARQRDDVNSARASAPPRRAGTTEDLTHQQQDRRRELKAEGTAFHSFDCHIANHSPPITMKPVNHSRKPRPMPSTAKALGGIEHRRRPAHGEREPQGCRAPA